MWNKALNGHGLEPRPLDLVLGPPRASLHTLQGAQFGAKKGVCSAIPTCYVQSIALQLEY